MQSVLAKSLESARTSGLIQELAWAEEAHSRQTSWWQSLHWAEEVKVVGAASSPAGAKMKLRTQPQKMSRITPMVTRAAVTLHLPRAGRPSG